MRNLPRALIPVTVLLITAAVYLPTLDYEFVFDDHHQITEVTDALTWKWAPRYFTSSLWSLHPEVPVVYYRPVFTLWLMINYQLFGSQTAWWHLSAVSLHLVCTLLVYFLARRWTDEFVAGLAALLFGVHPVHVEAVAWISGASEPLWGIFFLASILCYFRWTEAGGKLWLAGSVALYVAAMLAKETAIVLVAVILICEALFGKGPARRRAVLVALYGAAAIAYLVVRTRAVPGLMVQLKPMPLSVVMATWPSMLMFYLKQLVWPVEMSELHYLPVVTFLSVRRLVLPAVVLAALAFVLLRWSQRDRAAGFAWSLLLIPILPALDFRVFGMDEMVHDRYAYIPSVGLFLLAALAWKHVTPHFSWLIPIVAAAGFLSYRTVRESAYWHDDVALFQRAYEVAPQHVMAPEDLGQVLFLRGQTAEAMPYLERAVAMGSHNREVFFTLGRIHFANQDWERAAVFFEQARLGDFKIARYLLFQGVTDFHRDRLAEAEEELREAIRVRPAVGPDIGMAHLALSYVLEKRGDVKGALEECMAELKEHPNEPAVQEQIRRLGTRPPP